MKHIALIIVVLFSFTFCKKKDLGPSYCTNPYSNSNDTIYLSNHGNYIDHIDGLTYVLEANQWTGNTDNFVWSTGDTANAITVSNSADYTLYIYTENWELYDSTIFYIGTLTENIQTPNSFTPNHDLINDEFKPITYAICPDSYSFLVYTDKNDLIFETHHPSFGWDGYRKGAIVSQGYYTYQIQATTIDGEYIEKKGEIYLIR